MPSRPKKTTCGAVVLPPSRPAGRCFCVQFTETSRWCCNTPSMKSLEGENFRADVLGAASGPAEANQLPGQLCVLANTEGAALSVSQPRGEKSQCTQNTDPIICSPPNTSSGFLPRGPFWFDFSSRGSETGLPWKWWVVGRGKVRTSQRWLERAVGKGWA